MTDRKHEGPIETLPGSGPLHGDDLSGRIAAGDSEAESQLVLAYRSGLLVMFRHRLRRGANAEDLCQETLRIALEGLRAGRLRQPEKLAAYLWGIADKLARKAQSRRRDELPDALEELIEPGVDPERRVLAREQARLVREAIGRLSPRDRVVLSEFYLEQRDKAEVCRRLRLTPAQFDLIKFRALQRLSREWEAAGSPVTEPTTDKDISK